MKVLLKITGYALVIAIFIASLMPLQAQDKTECNSKNLRERMVYLKSMDWVKTSDTTLGFSLKVGAKVKVLYKQQAIAEIDATPAYIVYKQSAEKAGKKTNYLLLITVGSKNHSYFFVGDQEIRQLEPGLQKTDYDYFHVAIDGDDLLFDFSQSGEKMFHLGIIKNNKFCDGGEVPF